MANYQPFTIEILDLGRGESVVVDRVTGATVYMEEAKRIGRHLLSLTGLEAGRGGYQVLSADSDLLYAWPADDAKALN
jgi:hypothetical protein